MKEYDTPKLDVVFLQNDVIKTSGFTSSSDQKEEDFFSSMWSMTF